VDSQASSRSGLSTRGGDTIWVTGERGFPLAAAGLSRTDPSGCGGGCGRGSAAVAAAAMAGFAGGFAGDRTPKDPCVALRAVCFDPLFDLDVGRAGSLGAAFEVFGAPEEVNPGALEPWWELWVLAEDAAGSSTPISCRIGQRCQALSSY